MRPDRSARRERGAQDQRWSLENPDRGRAADSYLTVVDRVYPFYNERAKLVEGDSGRRRLTTRPLGLVVAAVRADEAESRPRRREAGRAQIVAKRAASGRDPGDGGPPQVHPPGRDGPASDGRCCRPAHRGA